MAQPQLLWSLNNLKRDSLEIQHPEFENNRLSLTEIMADATSFTPPSPGLSSALKRLSRQPAQYPSVLFSIMDARLPGMRKVAGSIMSNNLSRGVSLCNCCGRKYTDLNGEYVLNLCFLRI